MQQNAAEAENDPAFAPVRDAILSAKATSRRAALAVLALSLCNMGHVFGIAVLAFKVICYLHSVCKS